MEHIQKEIEQIKKFIEEQSIFRKDVLTLGEAALYLGQSRNSIYKLTCKRKITHYKPGGKKIYFKRTELDSWIYRSRVTPTDEVELEVENYLSRVDKI